MDIGYNWGNDIRLKLTYSESLGSGIKTDINPNETTVNAQIYSGQAWNKSESILATIYKEFSSGFRFKPYIARVIGSTHVEVDLGLYCSSKGIDLNQSSLIY